MLINNKQARAVIVSAEGSSVVLVPGLNFVDEKSWKKMEKNIKSESYLVPVRGKKKVKSKNKDGKDIETEVEELLDFADVPVDAIPDVVNSIMSLDQLNKFLEAETRESVRVELNRRRTAIEKELGL